MADPDAPLGYDMYLREDMDPGGRASSGEELLISDLIHRTMEDTMVLIGSETGAVDWGKDARRLCGRKMTESQARQEAALFTIVFERDERVAKAEVDLVSVFANGLYELRMGVSIEPASGRAFHFVLDVSAVTVSLLGEGQ